MQDMRFASELALEHNEGSRETLTSRAFLRRAAGSDCDNRRDGRLLGHIEADGSPILVDAPRIFDGVGFPLLSHPIRHNDAIGEGLSFAQSGGDGAALLPEGDCDEGPGGVYGHGVGGDLGCSVLDGLAEILLVDFRKVNDFRGKGVELGV